jgi:hypothetical protein
VKARAAIVCPACAYAQAGLPIKPPCGGGEQSPPSAAANKARPAAAAAAKSLFTKPAKVDYIFADI